MAWCRYASAAALEQLGGAVKASGEIVAHFSEIWDEECQAAAQGSDMDQIKLGVQRMEQKQLQKRLAGPLGNSYTSVSTSLLLFALRPALRSYYSSRTNGLSSILFY